MKRKRLTMRRESASCITSRSPPSWPARRMKLYPQKRPGTNPPRTAASVLRRAASSPQNLRRRRERLRKNPLRTISGSLSSVAPPGAGHRQRLRQGPRAPRPKKRGRSGRSSCASSRSKLKRRNRGRYRPRKRKAGSEVPLFHARLSSPWRQKSVPRRPLQL